MTLSALTVVGVVPEDDLFPWDGAGAMREACLALL